jgi:exonuclease III
MLNLQDKLKLKILHWNANSIIGKHESVRELVLEQKPDIISLECNELGRTPPQERLCSLGYILFIGSR